MFLVWTPFHINSLKKKFRPIFFFFSLRSRPDKIFEFFFLKNVFRDNGHSLGQCPQKSLMEMGFQAREYTILATFPASDRKKKLQELKRTIKDNFFFLEKNEIFRIFDTPTPFCDYLLKYWFWQLAATEWLLGLNFNLFRSKMREIFKEIAWNFQETLLCDTKVFPGSFRRFPVFFPPFRPEKVKNRG